MLRYKHLTCICYFDTSVKNSGIVILDIWILSTEPVVDLKVLLSFVKSSVDIDYFACSDYYIIHFAYHLQLCNNNGVGVSF